MMRIRVISLVLGGWLLLAPSAAAQVAPPEPPALPDLAPVVVDPSTTAFLILDITTAICTPNATCMATVPAISRLLTKARSAGAFVAYSKTSTGDVLPDVAPRANDPVVATRADKFFNTDLDAILSEHGIQTAVMVGSAANGAVMYTAFGAVERGYTVVVAVDGISSGVDFATYLAEFQLLNMPGFSNPTNQPLAPNNATLSRGDLITFSAVAK